MPNAPPWLLSIVVVAVLGAPAAAVVNPHEEDTPGRCASCHVRVPDEQAVKRGEFGLARTSIDEVCLVCHSPNECCRVGQDHDQKTVPLGASHVSDVDLRDVPATHRPRTLPVRDGKITCYTCHFHSRQPTNNYKMVRMVEVKETGVDWTALCRDCHARY